MRQGQIIRVDESVPLTGEVKDTPWEAAVPIQINEFPWNVPDAKRSTVVRSLYDEDALYLQYHADDAIIRADTDELNGPVWEDSCVEFFATLDPQRRPHYINVEVNCIGAFRLGFGPDRQNRELITANQAESIRVESSIDEQPAANAADDHWWVAIALPFETLATVTGVSISPSEGTVWQGNFHRLGPRDTSFFATWNPVNAPKPDFHQPSEFGPLVFK
ncbi:carbohydrate-binding family 9-like protein [Halopiger aswanensis]|uniref:Cellulose/xylan binding protein with CBM9 domain n=1 Tax=Halopiger aswanensis TaxID=148449 RepID=A0A419VVW9_9EURY|nr:carbohydrate-binding family 9-like protein [Halopiger aswanensis]RKD86293.1 cellulose/xylan binding protein with CBM9 domain [Halopiger aswanensis]